MKKTVKTAVLVTAVCLLSMPFLHAEWFDGEVQKIDLAAQEFTLSEVDPITEVEEAEVVAIVPATIFAGVKSLKEIKVGDEVSVEAKYDEKADTWQAVSVEVPGAGE